MSNIMFTNVFPVEKPTKKVREVLKTALTLNDVNLSLKVAPINENELKEDTLILIPHGPDGSGMGALRNYSFSLKLISNANHEEFDELTENIRLAINSAGDENVRYLNVDTETMAFQLLNTQYALFNFTALIASQTETN